MSGNFTFSQGNLEEKKEKVRELKNPKMLMVSRLVNLTISINCSLYSETFLI